jgi:type IV fimbrial biogenesis protein FimT
LRVHVREYGFTLIELMVTLAVMAILLALAVPSFNEFLQRARTRGTADAYVNLVTQARAAAVKSGRDVTIGVRGTASDWCLGANGAPTPASGAAFGTSAACDCTAASNCSVDGDQLVLQAADYQGATVDAVGGTVTIDGKLGLQQPTGATTIPSRVTLARINSPDNNYELEVQIAPMGQATACVPASSRPIQGYPACP